jgi:tRNA nucleotidyltransferase (CCA-adding enzyme)
MYSCREKAPMEIYQVGGSVRDLLMNREPRDKDFLIINASEEELLNKGYTRVGSSYPVYLHPETKNEYVLSHDLKEDLKRRDLTINALAMDEDERIVDFFNGRDDLEQKILRHVSEAFADDPLRVFRVARFKAELPEFEIAPETWHLMQKLVEQDSFKKLKAERIFGELKKALSSSRPSLFFEVLKNVNGLWYYFPELDQIQGIKQQEEYHSEGDAYVHTMLVLDHSARISTQLKLRYACLVHDLGKGVPPQAGGVPLVKKMGKRLCVPNDWTEAAVAVTRFHLQSHRIQEMNASSIVRMFYELDAFRKPELVWILARSAEANDLKNIRTVSDQYKKIEEYFEIVKNISAKDISSRQVESKAFGEAIRALRVQRLKDYLRNP